jgi:hypothetical protein
MDGNLIFLSHDRSIFRPGLFPEGFGVTGTGPVPVTGPALPPVCGPGFGPGLFAEACVAFPQKGQNMARSSISFPQYPQYIIFYGIKAKYRLPLSMKQV